MFKKIPKKQRSADTGAVLEWGESFGAYGFTFVNTWEGPRMPGPLETSVSLRRVRPDGATQDEVQITIDLRQRYNSGANSRSMLGSMSLRGDALTVFESRVMSSKEQPITRAEIVDVLKWSLQTHERCKPQLRGVLPCQDTDQAIAHLVALIAKFEGPL